MDIYRSKQEDKQMRCNWCGRFVSYKDLKERKATHIMILPDSDRSYETWETTCERCRERI